jgi:hypothetical protein
LALFAIVLIVTVAVVIPAVIVGVGYVLGFGECDRPDTAATSSVCSAPGRLLLMAALIAVGLPLARLWAKFLARTFAFKTKEATPPDGAGDHVSLHIPANVSTELPGWQRMISGRIELDDPSAHTFSFGGVPLTFWSVYALQKGWLRQGDRTIIVYQRTLLKGLNLALAYWDGRLSLVRCVAPGAQTASVLIAAACILVFGWLSPPFGRVWIALCGVLIVVSSAYLVVMLRARTALRHFVDSEATR